AFFGQSAKCEVAHTSFRLAPLKSGMATSVWWPGGDTWHQNQNQLGSHMSSGYFLRYRPSWRSWGGRTAIGLRRARHRFTSLNFRFCTKGTDMREHVLLFCLLGLVLTATIILVTAPGAVTWALSLIE